MNLSSRLLAFALPAFLLGCGGGSDSKGVAPPTKITKPADDKVGLALDLFRQGTGLDAYRESLALLRANLGRPEVQPRLRLRPEQEKYLAANGVTPAELDELNASSFQPLDPHHVEA